jgi:hypothetical protein
MRSLVGWLVVSLGFAGGMSAQSLSEFGAAAAGGATGGAAGKKVSEGITAIFGKVDKQTADAAKQTKPTAAKTAAPAVASAAPSAPTASSTIIPSPPKPAKTLVKKAEKDDGYSLVPPPPPIRRVAIGKPLETPVRMVAQAPVAAAVPAAPIPVPPPPPVTSEDLRRITPGINREDLLKLGAFASRITMVDDGHLAETFRYTSNGLTVGVVRVNDGVVAAVELR